MVLVLLAQWRKWSLQILPQLCRLPLKLVCSMHKQIKLLLKRRSITIRLGKQKLLLIWPKLPLRLLRKTLHLLVFVQVLKRASTRPLLSVLLVKPLRQLVAFGRKLLNFLKNSANLRSLADVMTLKTSFLIGTACVFPLLIIANMKNVLKYVNVVKMVVHVVEAIWRVVTDQPKERRKK